MVRIVLLGRNRFGGRNGTVSASTGFKMEMPFGTDLDRTGLDGPKTGGFLFSFYLFLRIIHIRVPRFNPPLASFFSSIDWLTRYILPPSYRYCGLLLLLLLLLPIKLLLWVRSCDCRMDGYGGVIVAIGRCLNHTRTCLPR